MRGMHHFVLAAIMAACLMAASSSSAQAHHYGYYYTGPKVAIAPGASFAYTPTRVLTTGYVVAPYSYRPTVSSGYYRRSLLRDTRVRGPYLPLVTPGTSFYQGVYYPQPRVIYRPVPVVVPVARSGELVDPLIVPSVVAPAAYYNTRPAFSSKRNVKVGTYIPGVRDYRRSR